MTISITTIAHNSNAAGATVAATVPGGGVPSGGLIVVCTDEFSTAAAGTVGDTAGNTYTKISSKGNNNSNGSGWGAIYYAWNCLALSSGNTITYTKNTSGRASAITAFYATGIINSSDPLDSSVTATPATGSSTTPSVTSGTPSVSGELFVGFISSKSASTDSFTQDSTHAAYATPPTADIATTNTGVRGGSVVNAGSSALTYAPTITTNDWAAFIVGFKPDIGSVSMSAAVGAFALSGIAAVFNTSLISTAGSYALTGIAVAFNTSMIEAVGTFALTGIAAALGVSMPVAAASFTFTGISASFKIAMPAAVASYMVTGIASGLKISMTANSGSYVLTVFDANLQLPHPFIPLKAWESRPTPRPWDKRFPRYVFWRGGIKGPV